MNERERIARTIAGLYNAASSPGLGRVHRIEGKLAATEAKAFAEELERTGRLYLDWHKGRVMKIDVRSGVAIDFTLYDRDNGPGSGERAARQGLTDPFYDELGAQS